MKQYYVYFVANWTGKTLYTGVTSNLEKRIQQHKNGTYKGFSSKYKTNKLVYFETVTDINAALEREKQIKNWRRDKKDMLVKKLNPEWKDLSESWYEDSSTSLGMTRGEAQ